MPQSRALASALAAAAAFILLLAPGSALAAAGTCTATSTVNFGTFTGSEIDVNGSITITCSGGSGNNTFNVRINAGTGSTNFTTRFLTSGTSHLSYQLYTDAAHTHIFGDNSGGTSQLPITLNYVVAGQPVTVTATFYAVLPAQTVPPLGTYTTTIAVTFEAGGASGSGSIIVSAIVAPLCTVASSDLDFGNFTAGTSSSPLPGLATVTANCATGTPYAIGLSEGLYPGATTSTRRMTLTGGGTESLTYGLYSDATHTINWGDNFNGTPLDVVEGTGTGVDQEIPVYGQIDGNQNVSTGLYEDTILVTLQF